MTLKRWLLAACLPRRKKPSLKEEVVSDPEEVASPSIPKKGKFSSEEPEAAAGATKSAKKNKKFQRASRED